MSHNQELGKKGEALALEMLLEKGYRLLAQNWKSHPHEIDLLMTDREYLVVVEVKTRLNAFFGEPQDFVSRAQQKSLIRAANAYVELINWQGPIRFDIVAIVFEPELKKVHFKEAFYP